MEGFDIHRPYLKLEVQELLKRKSLRFESVSQLPLPEDLERDLKCVVCRELAILGAQWCHDGHLVCSSCVKEFCVGKDKIECPVVIVGPFEKYLCQKKLTGHDNGMPRHMDLFLQLLQPLPCGATKYGCTFTGRKAELLQHEINDCSYRKLRVCFLPGKDNEDDPCAQRFATHEGLVAHWIDHGVTVQHDPRTVVHFNFKHPSDLSDEWVVIDRRLVDYPGDHFCVLTICENKTHIRMWLRETDHLADPAALPFYFVSTPAESVHYLDCFRTRILPYSEKDLVKTDDIHAKEFKKNFLRVTADGSKDGNLHVSFAFEFLVTPTSEPSIKDNKSLLAPDGLIMKPPKESPATKEKESQGPEENMSEGPEQKKPEGPEEKEAFDGPVEKKASEGPEEKEAFEGPGEEKSPATEEKKSPATEEKKSPAPEENKSPATEEKKSPATEEKKSPATEEKKSPAPEEKKSPATEEKKSPAPEENKSPATEEKKSPATEEKKSPATEEEKSPATEEKKSPATEEKKSPATDEKKYPATGENETQGPEETDSSATVKHESPATEEKVSLATEHQHHDTQPNILKSGAAQQEKGSEATAEACGSSNARDTSTRDEQHPKSPTGRERGNRIRKRSGPPRYSSPWQKRDQNQSGEK